MMKRAERIAELVAFKSGRNTKVVKVKKNNVERYGIGIETEKENMFVTAYFDENDGRYDWKIAEEIVAGLKRKGVLEPDFDVEEIFSKEFIYKNVFPCLVPVEGNEKLLEENANVRFLDMAIVFRVMVEEDNDCNGSYLLKNCLLEKVKGNVPEIFDIARKNMVEKHSVKIIQFEAIHSGKSLDEVPDVPETESKMAVMTNKDNYYGANAFLRKDLLKKYADKIGKDLYIIPSSVHELILLGKDRRDLDDIKNMVHDVNTNVLDDEEMLSYNIYEYSRERNEISVAP